MRVTRRRLQAQRVGDIRFSLTYLPSAERLTVVVVEARHLRPVDASTNHSAPPLSSQPQSINC